MQRDKPFRIATDRRSIGWGEGTGVARYRDALGEAMGAAGESVGDGGTRRGALIDLPRTLRSHHRMVREGQGWAVPDLYRLAQRHFTLTGRLLELYAEDAPPLAHWSHPMPIRLAGAVNLYTVHDLIPLEQPELTGMSARRQARLLEMLAGEHFVTVSQTVRQALIARFGLAGDRVTCCYQAVDAGPVGDLAASLTRGGYLLVIGRMESRKNIVRLLKAHAESGVDLPLVIAGPEGHWREGERVEAEALMVRGNVVRLPWQPAPTAAALIANARALLMPSLAEGFGLPAIEAMLAGVPAMVAKFGAAAEIAGAGALAVDPFDTGSIARGIAALHGDEALRTALIAQGHEVAQLYLRESFAARLAHLYERSLE